MKLKYRIIVLLCAAFILLVSFKILQPEFGNSAEQGERDVPESQQKYLGDISKQHLSSQEIVNRYIDFYSVNLSSNLSRTDAWKLSGGWLTDRAIHPDHVPMLGDVLYHMYEARITHADVGHGGTQLKIMLTLEGNQKVVFKPKWYSRDYVVVGKPYDGRDRHNAEILAFHLNRILGFNRTPLAVGRNIDLMKEVVPVAHERLLQTFFNKGDNVCFYGKCAYCKSRKDGVCADGSHLEGALILWLPSYVQFELWKHPWRRSYRNDKYRQWERDDKYCDEIKKVWPYSSGPRLLDLIDTNVLDYLIGNADRHHYETFKGNNQSILVMLDNAKSLGTPYEDEASILAPLKQCCRLRYSTWTRLKELGDGVLGKVLEAVVSSDPIAPVTNSKHYSAIDRRLLHILQQVNTCIHKHGSSHVLIRDQYSSSHSPIS